MMKTADEVVTPALRTEPLVQTGKQLALHRPDRFETVIACPENPCDQT